MKILRDFFESLPWWTLEPAPEMLTEQPGDAHAKHFISAARSASGDVAVLYLPAGGTVRLCAAAVSPGCAAEWVNPETGERTRAESGPPGVFPAPSQSDWLLLLRGPTVDGA